MNEELAYRTIAYLIGCYKNNDETTINQEEIDAINFILNENQQLKEQLEASEKARKEAIELINNINDWEICSKYDCMYKDDVLDVLRMLDIDKGEYII